MGIFDWLFGGKKKAAGPATRPSAGGSRPALEAEMNALPESGVTVHALRALDFVAPGDWKNHTDFHRLAAETTGEEGDFLEEVKKRAHALYEDESQGYRTAMGIYHKVDFRDRILGTAAMADKVGGHIKLLSFLEKLTPKADTTQAVDVSIKVASELLAFTKLHGLPGDSVGDFVKALTNYSRENQMRMAALICFDGLIPLGPDFIDKCADGIGRLTPEALTENRLFKRVQGFIPGGQLVSQMDFLKEGFGAVTGWMDAFVKEKNLSADVVAGKLRDFIDFSDDKLDYLAAFLDVATNYYEHTGTQSVARAVVERAVSEV